METISMFHNGQFKTRTLYVACVSCSDLQSCLCSQPLSVGVGVLGFVEIGGAAINISHLQGGIKYFTSWEPRKLTKYFARDSVICGYQNRSQMVTNLCILSYSSIIEIICNAIMISSVNNFIGNEKSLCIYKKNFQRNFKFF